MMDHEEAVSLVALEDTRTWAAFAGAVVIGGANFVGVTFSNMELAPLYGAAVRFALAAVLFLLIARLWRVRLARGRVAVGSAAYGLLAYGLAYACLYYALLGLSAGTVSVIVAAVPLFTLVLAVALRLERLTLRGVLGSLLVIVGIAVLSAGALEGGLRGRYLLAAVAGAVSVAGSSVFVKGMPNVHPVNLNAFGMAAGAVLLAVGSRALGEAWTVPTETSTWLAVAYLVILGSVGLFQLFLYVIRRWTASATVYAVAGMPVVASALGALLLDQPVTPSLWAGGGLVILAVWVGAAPNAGKGGRAVADASPAKGTFGPAMDDMSADEADT